MAGYGWDTFEKDKPQKIATRRLVWPFGPKIPLPPTGPVSVQLSEGWQQTTIAAGKFDSVTLPQDLSDLVSDLPISEMVWLLGGFLRRWQEGGYAQWDDDIDLFLSHYADLPKVTADMEHRGWKLVSAPLAGVLEFTKGRPDGGMKKAQIISFHRFGSPARALAAFDFTINQAGVFKNAAGQLRLLTSPDFGRDISDRILRPVKPRTIRSFLSRSEKFIRAGYRFDETTLTLASKKLDGLAPGSSQEDYFNVAPQDEGTL